MKIYRIKLNTFSGILTPLQSDTIFGHLCWILAYRKGDKKLQEFLDPFKAGNPPFLISDGFPNDFLPKPLSADANMGDPAERKELKKIDLITLNDFISVMKGEKLRPSISHTIVRVTTPHNVISRISFFKSY